MKFNYVELAEFALLPGDHEGRLTYKSPSKTLYETGYKERWFKLKSNFLFYYRLNEFGGVGNHEPSGVFVLENCEVEREEEADLPFGFSIRWKDDQEKKYQFFTSNEGSLLSWMSKLAHSSYDSLRLQQFRLRVQIHRKTGKDPLQHLCTPLPPAQYLPFASHHISDSSFGTSGASSMSCIPSIVGFQVTNDDWQPPSANSVPNTPMVALKPVRVAPQVPALKMTQLLDPIRMAPPVPPIRPDRSKNEKKNLDNGKAMAVVSTSEKSIGRSHASFKSHLKGGSGN